MPDITTHTAVAVTVGASSASVAAGTFLGVEYAIFGVALLAASIAHIYLERMPLDKMLLSIFGSFVIGVVAAKLSEGVVMATAIHFAPWLTQTLAETKIEGAMSIAFLFSFTAQKTVPILFNWLDRKKGS